MRRRKSKKPVVQLTSLLDLLFVMIFVSLLQTKTTPADAESKKTKPKTKAPVAQEKPKKPEPPKPKEPKAPRPIHVNGVFKFYATANSPNVPDGAYTMGGSYDPKSGELQLGGTSWITRPPGFDMVPLKGKIDSNATSFTGRIEFQDCEEFTLRKTSTLSSSPIGGTWEGSYTCAQGETGLTLTIH